MVQFNGSSNITTQNLNPNSGTPTANSTVMVDMSREEADTVSIQVTGTYTGALTPQVSNDGANWVAMGGVSLISVNTGVGAATIASAAVGMWQADVASFRYFRISANAAVTGTATITMVATDANGVVGIDTPLPAGSNALGTVIVTPTASSPGTTQSTLNSAASTNATSVKATAGNIYVICINNASAATKYLRLYNKASAPTVGTDVPVRVIAVPATSSKEISFSTPIRFATGIAYAITSGAPVLDTTAVAAGDIQLAIDWF